jgi:hypothetical protein
MSPLLYRIESWMRRRSGFYDLRRIRPSRRKPQSPIIQFYSSSNNIGNYTPILGIRSMLGVEPDTWCIHDTNIDFDFINRSYRCAILGGAGLLHACFEPFWGRLARECRIPLILWGLGGCFPTRVSEDMQRAGVSRTLVQQVANRCDLINLRDDITADYYCLASCSITACPTVEYLDKFSNTNHRKDGYVLLSEHRSLVGRADSRRLRNFLRASGAPLRVTDNRQSFQRRLEQIIVGSYLPSAAVVTTRLHGAIIAYGLGIPYLSVTRDQKIEAFHRLYGNGLNVDRVEDVIPLLPELLHLQLAPRELGELRAFGQRARAWTESHMNKSCSLPSNDLLPCRKNAWRRDVA